jgi:hypothetical protein
LSEQEIADIVKKVVKTTIEELQAHKPPHVCCGGLDDEQIKKIDGWTHDGDLFNPEQRDALRGFSDALVKGKKYFVIGFGIVLALALRDVWGVAWRWLQHFFHKGGTWT